MKLRLSLSLAALAVLAGCGGKTDSTASATNSAATGGNPLEAPADYLRAVSKGQQNAVKTVDTTSLTKAIQLFNVDQGRNPTDLNELVQKKYIPQIPPAPVGMKLVYDASAGTVTVEKE